MLARRGSHSVDTRSFCIRQRRFASAAWIVASVPLATLAAAAEPALNGAPAAASAHFERGVAHFDAGEMDAAAREFEAAFATQPHPAVLFNLGRAYVALGRSVEAVRVLEEYLASQEAAPSKQRREAVEALIRAQRQRIGHLVVASAQDGVLISIDGIDVGMTPLPAPLPLTIGRHGVVARVEGNVVQAYSVTIEPRVELELNVHVESGEAATTAAAAPAPATAAASPAPVAKTATPLPPLGTPPPAAASQATALGTTGLVLIGGGIVAAGFGTYFSIHAANSWDARNQHCKGGCNAEAVEAWKDADQFASLSNAAFAVSIISAGIGAYLTVKSVTSSSAPAGVSRRPVLALSKTGQGWFVHVTGKL